MSWSKEWRSIEVCIEDLCTICNEHVAALKDDRSVGNSTVYSSIITPMATDIANRISSFGNRYRTQLSGDVIELLEDFTHETLPFINGFESENRSTNLPLKVTISSALLRRFRSDINYLTSDLTGSVLRLTARGFSHLQRSIVADQQCREKWIDAFNKDEMACEKLGAVHLLQHGIWAFKVDSIGGRTDLVLGEPVTTDLLTEASTTAEGLVLTEWKRANPDDDIDKKFQEAMEQAKQYSMGSLAGFELKSYRYLVAVTEKQAPRTPEDRESNGMIYKHINIAVDPDPPSTAAKKMKN